MWWGRRPAPRVLKGGHGERLWRHKQPQQPPSRQERRVTMFVWGQLPALGMSPGPEARRVRLRCRLVAQTGRPSVLCTLVRASGSALLGSRSVVRCASVWLVVTRWYRAAGAQRSICRRAPERPSRYAAVWPSTANSIESSALAASCAEATPAIAASIVSHIAREAALPGYVRTWAPRNKSSKLEQSLPMPPTNHSAQRTTVRLCHQRTTVCHQRTTVRATWAPRMYDSLGRTSPRS